MPGHLVQQSDVRAEGRQRRRRDPHHDRPLVWVPGARAERLSFPIGRSQRSAMAGHEQSLFVLSGSGDALPRRPRPPRAGARHRGLHRLGRVVLDRERRPRAARRPGRRRADARRRATRPRSATRRVTVNFATQPDLEAGIGRTFRLLVDPDVGCSGFTQFMGEIPVGRAPDHSHTYDEVVYVVAGEGFLHMARRDPADPRGLVHLPAAAAHALPRERRRRTACACWASSSRPAARPRATPRRPEWPQRPAATRCRARSATASRCSSTRSTSTAARRACSPTRCAPPTPTTCGTGTRRALPGSTGWSAPSRRARASPASSAPTTTRSPSRPRSRPA